MFYNKIIVGLHAFTLVLNTEEYFYIDTVYGI